ncbi:MAG: LPS assembly lipoprotein LptE [Gammaproteobacteria bacterium]|nr:LPS assembly lipoprotein LptE [Gammaproteobacteria bacterium]MDH5734752.1 LPS assembly lipoprotein LptE [Gammaproteobacteria bacterium]
MTQTHKQAKQNIILRQALLALLVISMTACGFHLRGAYQLPDAMAKTYVQAANQNSELIRSLKRSLKANNILVVENTSDATAVLKITSESQNKRVLSVDSKGRAREYELSYAVGFHVQTGNADFSMAEQELKLEREFLFDTEDVLGKGREESTLIKDMQQDMVRLILLRLQLIGNQ